MEYIGLALYSCGAAAYLVLAATILYRRAFMFDWPGGLVGALCLAGWQAALAWHVSHPLTEFTLLTLEIGRALVVGVFTARALRGISGKWPEPRAALIVLGFVVLAPVGIESIASIPAEALDFTLRRAWSGVFIAIGMLIMVEQLLRNMPASLTVGRFTALALGVTAIYDLYLFADALIFEQLDIEQWRARGGINALAALSMALVAARGRVTRAMALSRGMVFYTTSLTFAGLFLLTVSVLGYAIRRYGGSWGAVIQLMLFFSAIFLALAASISERFRSRLRVYVSKNFFELKYDYRQEWLHLIGELSSKLGKQDLHVRAIRVLADLYKCGGGVLWLRQDGYFAPVAPCRMRLPNGCEEPDNTAFCTKLAEGWIFEFDVAPRGGVPPPPPPDWITKVPELDILVPLLVEDELIGFVGLQRSLGFAVLDWEDLEILKTAARQVASDLARYQVAEELARARQFDTYHQLTAFIMHDLKNLIAQQELVVKNAAKHKSNPAFVEDAINTIQNCASRMSTLLAKMQQREPAERRPVSLRDALTEAVKKCEGVQPVPTLHCEASEFRILSDRERLTMILGHVIKNAQEATTEEGRVDVRLHSEGDTAVIEVEDNGCGMDRDFLRNRLFAPFESTKAGKGMGIGAFQAREFVRSLGGDVRVSSEPGVGTTFRLEIPFSAAAGDAVDPVARSTPA